MQVSRVFAPACVSLLVLLLAVPENEATFAITIPAISTAAITLTATQVSALAGIALLGKAAGVLTGAALTRAFSGNGGRSSRRFSRGRREAYEVDYEVNEKIHSTLDMDEKINSTMEMLVDMEPEHCFKRVFCAASTGQYTNDKLAPILDTLNDQNLRDSNSRKFVKAAQNGVLFGDVAKCERRYRCPLTMEIITTMIV